MGCRIRADERSVGSKVIRVITRARAHAPMQEIRTPPQAMSARDRALLEQFSDWYDRAEVSERPL